MLRSVKEFEGYHLLASDGKIGHITDCLFDDQDWTLRYLVADLGSLTVGQVLISTDHLDQPEVGKPGRRFKVNLSTRQIKQSPPLDADAPLSRRYEIDLAEHYKQVQPYWKSSVFDPAVADHERRLEEIAECHLRSVKHIHRFHVHGSDGKIGHIHDFIIDTKTWKLKQLVVKTREILPGASVLIDIDWIKTINRTGIDVHINLTCEQIKNSPTFNHRQPVNQSRGSQLYDYYGRPRN